MHNGLKYLISLRHLNRLSKNCHPGLDPGFSIAKKTYIYWIPVFAGMTNSNAPAVFRQSE